MRLIIIPVLFVSLFAFHPTYTVRACNLQCMLNNGEQMTLSHVNNIVYISSESSGGDSERSGSIIELDIPSGETEQILAADPGAGTTSFTLRGENEDIESAVAADYSEYDDTGDAYCTVMNAMGQEISTISCKPGTIKVSRSLLQDDINGADSQQANRPDSSQQQQAQQFITPLFKAQLSSSVSNEGWNTKCGVIQLTIADDNVVLKSIRVNRGNCRMESVDSRTLSAKHKSDDVATFKYMKCDRIIEADIVAGTGS